MALKGIVVPLRSETALPAGAAGGGEGALAGAGSGGADAPFEATAVAGGGGGGAAAEPGAGPNKMQTFLSNCARQSFLCCMLTRTSQQGLTLITSMLRCLSLCLDLYQSKLKIGC